MVIEVGIELVNERDEDVVIDIPVGSIFEVGTLRDQNVATSQPYRFTIPPRSRLITQVRGVCLNRDLSPPAQVPGQLTPFRFDADEIDQNTVWEAISNPMGV